MASIVENTPPAAVSDIPLDETDGDPNGQKFEKTYRCTACSLTFKESQFQTYKGKRYGIPCGCYKDIARYARRD